MIPNIPINPEQGARAVSQKIRPDDPRYADLNRRGFNKRYAGQPDYIRLAGSTSQVVAAVQDAVNEKLRFAVRSGGHCLENFVANPAVRVVIDTSLMADITYDQAMGAFSVEAGAALGEVYRRLALGWGVALPAGISPQLGAGGHILGGAFGYLSRQFGLAVDHLYAVEVVVVDGAGKARSVIATREPDDANRELWWAHTGCGGGNLGVVTRYWFRSPGAQGNDPAGLLPRAPDSVLRFKLNWNWADIDKTAFTRLLTNHGDWCEANSAPGSPAARLYSTLVLARRPAGRLEITGIVTGLAGSDGIFADYFSAITAGIKPAPAREVDRTTWLAFALYPFPDIVVSASVEAVFKIKDAFLRKRPTDRQIDVAYHHLTRMDYSVPGIMLGMANYGGQINSVPSDATASAQRGAILTLSVSAGWADPVDEPLNLACVRQFYQDLFADTGGVPVPNEATQGAFINHPDRDLADPAINTSGVPWYTLYYQDNYPRLQHIKARWDPLGIFTHALAIQPG